MSGQFSDDLRRQFDPVWEAQHQHPFVRALGDGSLAPARFQVWLAQNELFLADCARLFALGGARCDADVMRWMLSMANDVFGYELLLHQAYAVEFGGSRLDLPRTEKLPTTRAYTDHLLRTASLGSQLELVAALLPCVWGHAEIGQRLAKQPRPTGSRYGRWIDKHSGPVADRCARQARDLLDRLASGAGEAPLLAAADAFRTSSRYEWMFLEMCDKGEGWRI